MGSSPTSVCGDHTKEREKAVGTAKYLGRYTKQRAWQQGWIPEAQRERSVKHGLTCKNSWGDKTPQSKSMRGRLKRLWETQTREMKGRLRGEGGDGRERWRWKRGGAREKRRSRKRKKNIYIFFFYTFFQKKSPKPFSVAAGQGFEPQSPAPDFALIPWALTTGPPAPHTNNCSFVWFKENASADILKKKKKSFFFKSLNQNLKVSKT